MKDTDFRKNPEDNPDLNGEIQRSLVLFKPDTVQRGIVGEILSRFERLGLKIIGVKMVEPDEKQYFKHYEEIGQLISRRGQDAFEAAMDYMTLGPVIAMVFEGVEAVPVIRKIVGTTEPWSAQPGTIRGDYAHISFGYANPRHKAIPNLIHASGNLEEAKQEIAIWFSDEELFDYEGLKDKYMR